MLILLFRAGHERQLWGSLATNRSRDLRSQSRRAGAEFRQYLVGRPVVRHHNVHEQMAAPRRRVHPADEKRPRQVAEQFASQGKIEGTLHLTAELARLMLHVPSACTLALDVFL